MKKELLKMGLVVGLSTSLFGFTYELKDGWQQLGAVNDIDDLSVFNNQCIDYLWYYDNSGDTPEWKLHIANGNTYDYCGNSLESLKKGQGFWAKANGSCSITVGTDTNNNDCDSNMPAPPDLDNPECITCDAGNNGEPNDGTYIASSTFETCDLVLQNGDSQGDGVYLLDKDNLSYKAYCDMTTDSGGWTLIAKTSFGFTNEVNNLNITDDPDTHLILKRNILDKVISKSNKYFRTNDNEMNLKMYIYDTNPLFTINTHYWTSSANDVKCSKEFSLDLNNTIWKETVKTSNLDNAIGDHIAGGAFGWLLWHTSDAYNMNELHPCSLGTGSIPTKGTLNNIFIK